MKPRLALALLALTPSVAEAQDRPCFESEDVPLWSSVAVQAYPGASRPLSGGQELELCSQSLGTAELSDSYQGLMRGVTGDYSLTATLLDLDPDSSAGLLLSADTRRPDSAHFFILAERLDDGPTVLVRSGFRPSQGAESLSFDEATLEAALPLTLRLRRAEGVLTASIVDANGETIQGATPIADTELAAWGQVGLVQAGTSFGDEARARFGAPTFEHAFVPPAEVECLGETTLPRSGGTMRLSGRGFDRVLGVSLGGTELSVLEGTDEWLTVQVPPAAAAGFGKLRFDLGSVEQDTGRTLVTGGTPFVRGDLTGDGVVDGKDLKALRQALRNGTLPECRPTADVNGDGLVDRLDDAQLAGFLAGRRGAKPPAAPFPAPGIIAGLPACGLPAGPVVERLVNVDGTALAGRLTEGTLVRLEGSNLPLNPVVRFGNVVARVQPGATADQLVAMIGVVPSAGPRCLVLQSGAAAATPGQATFGLAYGDLASERPDLCPELVASRLDFSADAVADSDGALFLPIDPASWDPDLELHVNVSLAYPLVEGTSRGPRSASFKFKHVPPLEDGTAPVTYDSWLTALAAHTSTAIGAEDDCDCEAEVVPAPQDGGLWIAPCFQTTPVPPPPPLPPGTVPGGLSLKAARPSLGAANAFALPLEPSCEDLAGAGNARQIAWCHLAQLTEIRTEPSDPDNVNDHPSYVGLPRWEAFRPMHTLEAFDDTPWTIDPRDQPPALKETMVEPALADHLMSRDYFDACGIAARAAYCDDLQAMAWMPKLPPGKRIVKAFWKTLSELPMSADPGDFYSYDPPGFDRRYLVGMHVSVAKGSHEGSDYLTWATFWVPKPPGETLDKAGGPLSESYNEDCFVGGPQDRPEELNGTPFGKFSMCVQDDVSQHCGNPWGPKDECRPNPQEYVDYDALAPEGCSGCHAQRTQIDWGAEAPNADEPFMRMGWMAIPANLGNAARTCMTEIVTGTANGQSPYQNQAYCEMW